MIIAVPINSRKIRVHPRRCGVEFRWSFYKSYAKHLKAHGFHRFLIGFCLTPQFFQRATNLVAIRMISSSSFDARFFLSSTPFTPIPQGQGPLRAPGAMGHLHLQRHPRQGAPGQERQLPPGRAIKKGGGATCWWACQQVARRKGAPENCLPPGAIFSAYGEVFDDFFPIQGGGRGVFTFSKMFF